MNARLAGHANEDGPVDFWLVLHWANAPGGEIAESHELTNTEWANLRTEAVADDVSGFLSVLTAAVTPSGFSWGDSTGTKVKAACWEAGLQVWT